MNIWFVIWAFILTGAISALLGIICGKILFRVFDKLDEKENKK